MSKVLYVAGLMLMFVTTMVAQEKSVDSLTVTSNKILAENPVATSGTEATAVADTTAVDTKREKVDGVTAVVGDYVILESDIDKSFIDMQTQGVSTKGITRCQVLGRLMEDKLYAHQAIQDSIVVSDAEINSTVDRQLNFLVGQVGSIDKLLEFYRKEDEQSFREELFEIVKAQQLSQRMQAKVVEEIEITPEEVRQWYNGLAEDEKPVFGDEVEIAQIVKVPEPSDKEVQEVIDKLNEYKRDVEENGSSFAIKQTLYSDDPGKKENGGVYKISKSTGFVQEFKDVAFSLKEGEISDPFKTIFGYHIIYVEKIRGQERDIRHILLRPKISEEAIQETKTELDSIRAKILEGEFTFSEAARNFSDEKETRFDGGVLRNPETFDTKFELTKMDPTLYSQISPLQGDEISQPLMEETRTGVQFKLLKVITRFKSHKADYSQDYVKIKELALKEKQFDEIAKWMDEKIKDTYINVAADSRDCDFANNWLKK
ncbi:parvulin-like peptidyl-prolyl isomerase [Galbibacter orientalis DSM 19592]|uniref:Parvulin-like peptidyl-prolyl isomerase n=1 Tax=Galbibacter orientalis DSM 19592 TaxID=926559 RepID=I3C6D4_9FLAO|nr:peptidylprolyl isomerase [Galbibacter orientalis]EIJ39177.1 parvulin-like peptidyl-prolyl isomerase [Galbibacter orientalis DSM 19592]